LLLADVEGREIKPLWVEGWRLDGGSVERHGFSFVEGSDFSEEILPAGWVAHALNNRITPLLA
jgi:hypothetical protein